jgi:hypothetical protein
MQLPRSGFVQLGILIGQRAIKNFKVERNASLHVTISNKVHQ